MALATAAVAQTVPVERPADHAAGASAAATAGLLSDGEVRKVDRDLGKVTLRHGPITPLEMPAMTMVFRVADKKLLDGIKEGDKVKFTAERINGAITLTAIEAAR